MSADNDQDRPDRRKHGDQSQRPFDRRNAAGDFGGLEFLKAVTTETAKDPELDPSERIDTLRDDLCQACLEGYGELPNLVTLALRVSPHTHLLDQHPWIASNGGFEPEEELIESLSAGKEGTTVLPGGRCAVVVKVGADDEASLGWIVAICSSQEAAEGYMQELHLLDLVLGHGLKLLRGLTDRSAITQFSVVLSKAKDTGEALNDTATIIGRHMRAKGVKEFVLRAQLGSRFLELLCRTDDRWAESRKDPIDSEKGFASWVLTQKD